MTRLARGLRAFNELLDLYEAGERKLLAEAQGPARPDVHEAVLEAIARLRRCLASHDADILAAAEAAFTVGFFANNAPFNADLGSRIRANNRRVARHRWDNLKEEDAKIWEAARRYEFSHRGASRVEIAKAAKAATGDARTVEGIRGRLRSLRRCISPAGK